LLLKILPEAENWATATPPQGMSLGAWESQKLLQKLSKKLT
jgi:hypothetical protein